MIIKIIPGTYVKKAHIQINYAQIALIDLKHTATLSYVCKLYQVGKRFPFDKLKYFRSLFFAREYLIQPKINNCSATPK